jgi:hypothetical protein
MLQQMRPHHQPDRQPRPSRFAIVRREMRFQPHQLITQVDDVFSFERNRSPILLSGGFTLGFIYPLK